ncbi:DNA repair protein rhp54 [Elysia marginata]|uniref:DNA repair protein rhp54 n=1 Tax=Elysia marginata TaxID=1093978 RepID=A0AAV4I993_9GAST|nr:DNA repair protein rhp54 [Elysia marginata]
MCLSFSATPDPSQEQTQEHEAHLKSKETARDYKASIKGKANGDPTIVASCFDLQKVLPCPHGEASSFYYKRKLSTYNLTFYNMSSQDLQCYMWPEHISARGSNQIASCLWHHIQMHASLGKTVFNFISDNCDGQNRNGFVAAMFWFCMKTTPAVAKIEHGFLEVGHTQNENDSVHSVIAQVAKRIPVYTPGQWATVARGALRNKLPYAVKEMTAQDFFDFKAISKKIKNLDNDEDGEKVRWTKIRAITFNQSETDFMTIHYDDKVCRVDLMRRKRKSDEPEGQLDLQVLSDPAGVSEDNKKDLLSLCSSNLIPPAHHQFLKKLPVLK